MPGQMLRIDDQPEQTETGRDDGQQAGHKTNQADLPVKRRAGMLFDPEPPGAHSQCLAPRAPKSQ